jgi:hypothetical protein
MNVARLQLAPLGETAEEKVGDRTDSPFAPSLVHRPKGGR